MLAPTLYKSPLIEAIERRALEIARAIEDRNGEYYAQYIEGVKPKWHLVNVQPGFEGKAYEQLADRRFGVFNPRFAPDAILDVPVLNEHGRVLRVDKVPLGNKLIFPGRLFVFVWDVLAHWRRIRACPSVGKIMVDGKEQPVVMDDEVINKIQALQYSLRPMPKSKRKRYKATEGERMTISTRSFWLVDGAERTGALDAAVGAY